MDQQLLLIATRKSILRVKLDEARARFREATLHGFNGGLFVITPGLLAEIDLHAGIPTILIDSEGMPVEIADPSALGLEMRRKYKSALTRFNLDVKDARATHLPDLLDACVE